MSLGILSIPAAHAAQRTVAKPASVSIPGGFSLGDLFMTVQSWIRVGKAEYYGGQNPGNNPPGKEGAGICPLGNPGNNNPGKPGGKP